MRLVAFVSLVLLVAACDSQDDALQVDLRPGTALRYDVEFRDDSTDGGSGVLFAGQRIDRVVSAGQTLGALGGLTVVESEQSEFGFVFRTRTWYRPSGNRLEEVAYEFYGDGPGLFGLRSAQAPGDPALPRLVRLAIARRTAGRGGDSTWTPTGPQVRPTPRIVVEYPAEPGRTWQHFSETNSRSTREVVRLETVTTPAGTFPCVVVRSRVFSGSVENDDIEWLDAIGAVGLVRRTIVFRQQATDEQGNDLGLLVTTQTETLVAVE